MKKYSIMNKLMFVGISLIPITTLATEINLTINGSGAVLAKESATRCTENCILTNNQTTTLIAEPASGAIFGGWSGEKCDAGQGAFIADTSQGLTSVGNGAKTLASADVNGDDLADFATISLFDGEVALLTNQGEADFDKTVIDNNLAYPAGMYFFDWDNDGDQDLFVTEFNKHKIIIYTNNDNGNFSRADEIKISSIRPYALSIADINDDGAADLLISSFQANTSGDLATLVNSISDADVSWYLNDGDNNFSHHQTISNKAAITLDVHLNSTQGTINMVAAEIADTSITYYQLINGTLNSTVVNNDAYGYGATFGDIDDDGHLDILSAHYNPSKLNLMYNIADNGFSAATTIARFDEGVTATVLADVNNDSFTDIVSGEFNNNRFFYFLNEGYQDCIVNGDRDIELTASFEQETTTTPPPPPVVEEGSSGGSIGYLLFASLLLRVRLKRNPSK